MQLYPSIVIRNDVIKFCFSSYRWWIYCSDSVWFLYDYVICFQMNPLYLTIKALPSSAGLKIPVQNEECEQLWYHEKVLCSYNSELVNHVSFSEITTHLFSHSVSALKMFISVTRRISGEQRLSAQCTSCPFGGSKREIIVDSLKCYNINPNSILLLLYVQMLPCYFAPDSA